MKFEASKKKVTEEGPKQKTLYTITLTDDQMEALRKWCDRRLWGFYEVPYAHFGVKGGEVNVVAYKSGKLVVQGKKTEDFVTYVLEAEITKKPQMGYEEVHHPEWFEAHAGLDESGKGDFFGPLVTATVIADGDMVRRWMEKGLKESKRVTSDDAVLKMEKLIRETDGVVIQSMHLSMFKYNELYPKFGSNLNRLLAWMHAKALEEALKVRRVEWGMLDQFTKAPLVQNYFKKDGFNLKMETKAESDPVVAAASIIARAEYVRQMQKLSQLFGEKLPKGASSLVTKIWEGTAWRIRKAAFQDGL